MFVSTGLALLGIILVVGMVLSKSYRSSGSSTSKAGEFVEIINDKKDADILIVGAGIVGASLAATLGKQGRRVIAIERDLTEPNRIVGELLQPGGVEHLHTLGLQDCLEGIDSPSLSGYAVFNGEENVVLEYPPDSLGQKPFGRSFHHGRFVQNLRKAARDQSTVTLLEGTVTELIEDSESVKGVVYKNGQKTTKLYAPLVVVCDGVFSKFRKSIVSSKPIVNSSFVGFVVSNIKLPHGMKGHVFLTDGAPTLCYPISSHEARFLVDVPNPLPSNSDGSLRKYLMDNVVSQLPIPVKEAVSVELNENGTQIRSMPCSRLHPEQYDKKGVILVGDAWNMRHPITGGGMTVGLSDVILLRDILENYTSFDDQQAVQSTIKSEFFTKRVSRVAATNILAEAIYQVFAGRAEMKAMQQAIYAYFTLGPMVTKVPVSLLGCVVTNPWSLMFHFFTVAIYATGRMFIQAPRNIISSTKVLLTAAQFFIPLLFNERVVSVPLTS